MNAFSLDRSPHAQMTLPQMAVPLIQQPDQAPSLMSTNLIGSSAGNLFVALSAIVWVAIVFFLICEKAGWRQARYHDRTAVHRQQIQTLERIWQMSAKHKD